MLATRSLVASTSRLIPSLSLTRSFTTPSLSSADPPTIFAPATGRTRSAISILRISGPQSLQIYHKLTEPPKRRTEDVQQVAVRAKGRCRDPEPRKALLRRIVDPATGEALDEGLVLYFPSSSALTGQDTLELHTHGSPALLSLLLTLLPTLGPRIRIAEPGEFTRLAFEAGKLDLTEVEGIRDLVEADTEAQRKLAARQASGVMRDAYDAMRSQIIEASALCEALIDFGEDEGISVEVFEQARGKVDSLRGRITKALDDGRRGEIVRSGIKLAIVGAPNAGKSSLLNWIAQREAAIVSAIPGTTRDVVELALDLYGFPIQIADTAGLRKTTDEIEAIGVERAQQKAAEADLKLCVLSLPELFPPAVNATAPLVAHISPLTLTQIDSSTLILLNKTDEVTLTPEHYTAIYAALADKQWSGSEAGVDGQGKGRGLVEVSITQERGFSELVERLKSVLKQRFDLSDDMEDTPLVTHARHRHHLSECLASLDAFMQHEAEDIVEAAEELRYAVLALGRVTGAVEVEEVLGEIFRGFCVGK